MKAFAVQKCYRNFGFVKAILVYNPTNKNLFLFNKLSQKRIFYWPMDPQIYWSFIFSMKCNLLAQIFRPWFLKTFHFFDCINVCLRFLVIAFFFLRFFNFEFHFPKFLSLRRVFFLRGATEFTVTKTIIFPFFL